MTADPPVVVPPASAVPPIGGSRVSWRRYLVAGAGVCLLALAATAWVLIAQRPRRAAAPVAGAMPRRGSWNPVRAAVPPQLDSEAARKLQSIGYLSGSRPESRASVTVLDAQAAPGLNLYTSGHAPEATLMSMDGRVLHRWRCTYERAFPDQPPLPTTPVGREHWRRVRLLPGGDLVAIYEGQGLVRLDRDSNVRWALPIGAHHDLDVREDGTLLVLTRDVVLREDVNSNELILEDFVSEVSPDGRVLRRISILDAFLRSDYRAFLTRVPLVGDIMHTNTLTILDGRQEKRMPAFARGNLLLSSPHMGVVAVLDPREEKIVWATDGPWHFQHEPSLLANGDLLILDNRAGGRRSRALELDPLSRRITWSYGGTDSQAFFTEVNGSVQRLGNGDTLIVESDGGRAIEVTPAGKLVWEFYNPHRAGEQGQFIASLFDLVRLPAEAASFLR